MSVSNFEYYKEKFESHISREMARANIPGLSVAIVKDREIIYTRGFGSRNLQKSLPATPDTLYGFGSTTKSFTALAIMQLVEKGELNIQDAVSEHISLKLGSKDNPITIHHLLSHTSGIPGLYGPLLPLFRMTGLGEFFPMIPMNSWDELYIFVNGASSEVLFDPGAKFYYFNGGYTLLGDVVSRVSEMRFEDYLKTNILEPLNMKRSALLKENCENDPDLAIFYMNKDNKFIPTPHPFHEFLSAPGGILSSAKEMVNYLIFNMNGGKFNGSSVLNSSLLDQMHKFHTSDDDIFKSYVGDYGRTGYGYGWVIFEDFFGHKLLWHGGSTSVSTANLAFIPDLGIGIAQATNTGFSPLPIILGALLSFLGKDPEKEMSLFVHEKHLAQLLGKYQSFQGIYKFSVKKQGGMLFLESKVRGLNAPLIPVSDDPKNLEFYILTEVGCKAPVKFRIDSDESVHIIYDRFVLHKVN